METKEHKNIMEMSEGELGDFIDESLSDFEQKCKGKDKEIIRVIKGSFRMLQLQLNFIKARADLGKYHYIAHMKLIPEDIKKSIMEDVIRQKEEDNLKTFKEMEDLDNV